MTRSIHKRRAAGWGLIALVAALAVAMSTTASTGAQETTTFTVTIENRTNPEMIVTPGAYLLSTTAGAFWVPGGDASPSLERIAEVGEPGDAVAMLGAVALDPAPAFGNTVTFEVVAGPGMLLSTAQMLIATNDGFVGLSDEPLFDADGPRSVTIDLMAYDAGTEENADLFAGFDLGQPDPAMGAANIDNGTATAEPIAVHAQFTGPQARVTIEPVVVATPAPTATPEVSAQPAPAAAGNGGFNSSSGGSLMLVVALILLSGGLVLGARRATGR